MTQIISLQLFYHSRRVMENWSKWDRSQEIPLVQIPNQHQTQYLQQLLHDLVFHLLLMIPIK